jgi:hypothetical protein
LQAVFAFVVESMTYTVQVQAQLHGKHSLMIEACTAVTAAHCAVICVLNNVLMRQKVGKNCTSKVLAPPLMHSHCCSFACTTHYCHSCKCRSSALLKRRGCNDAAAVDDDDDAEDVVSSWNGKYFSSAGKLSLIWRAFGVWGSGGLGFEMRSLGLGFWGLDLGLVLGFTRWDRDDTDV